MKYKFTGETRTIPSGIILRQIVAVRDVNPNVPSGTIGGWIESEDNLSHDGKSWVSGDARISGNAWISGDAWVSGNARVSEHARISGNALVFGNALVSGNTQVSDDVRVSGNVWVSDHTLTKEQKIENRIKKLYGKCKTTVHWSK